jgi:phenylpyruvate tautomerase PptA (4-oxalocrotonate tautomerase family)
MAHVTRRRTSSTTEKELKMPVIHIYTPAGFVSPARKKLLVERVTAAAVESEGLPTTDMTYVLVHDVPDAGWGWQGKVITQADFAALLPPDPEEPTTGTTDAVPLERTS